MSQILDSGNSKKNITCFGRPKSEYMKDYMKNYSKTSFRQCQCCNKNISKNMWFHHVRTNKHQMKQQIFDLQNTVQSHLSLFNNVKHIVSSV
jgi:hypothetical protein